jgi:small-conductance mechanosensitive channel/CRP-like cAMP-binding protein
MIAVTWPWHDLSPDVQTTLVACVILLPALTVLLPILLPPPRRRWIMMPAMLGVLAGFLLACAALAGETSPGLRRGLVFSAYLFLLAGVGRCLFDFIFYGVLHWLHQHVPRIFVDVFQWVIYAIALFATLIAAGVEPQSLIAGSAVLSVVLGLALKDTLGNLFAGIAIQAQQPFEIGDWIQFDTNPSHIGRVVEFNWRAIKVITLDDVEVWIPNAKLGDGLIVNFTKPHRYSRRSVYVHAPYHAPPRLVQSLILNAMAEANGVLREPPPSVVTFAFDERGVQYWVRFFTDRFELRDGIDGGVRDCIWYALSRGGLAIPGVQQSVALRAPEADGAEDDPVARRDQALRGVPLFNELSNDERRRLAELAKTRLYAPNEIIVREGDAGDEMFVVLRGRAAVYKNPADAERVPISRLGPGDIFGEMAVLRDARRSATVQALEECELLAISAAAFCELIRSSPPLAERIRALADERQARLEDAVETLLPRDSQAEQPHFLLRLLAPLLPRAGDQR